MIPSSAPAAFSFVFSAYVGSPEQLAEVLKTEAREQVAQHAQYQGAFFDGWKLGRLTRTVRTKLGLAGSKGDLVLFRDEVPSHHPHARYVPARTFWSRLNAMATGVSVADVAELASELCVAE